MKNQYPFASENSLKTNNTVIIERSNSVNKINSYYHNREYYNKIVSKYPKQRLYHDQIQGGFRTTIHRGEGERVRGKVGKTDNGGKTNAGGQISMFG